MTSVDVRRTANGLGVDERTVWRWLTQDDDPGLARRSPRRTSRSFYDRVGNVAAVRRPLVDQGGSGLPSVATFTTAAAAETAAIH